MKIFNWFKKKEEKKEEDKTFLEKSIDILKAMNKACPKDLSNEEIKEIVKDNPKPYINHLFLIKKFILPYMGKWRIRKEGLDYLDNNRLTDIQQSQTRIQEKQTKILHNTIIFIFTY
tara:strand:+ start:718 stop:1068 length:351 start_codon:yes stop_codon:yes gene_type:complete